MCTRLSLFSSLPHTIKESLPSRRARHMYMYMYWPYWLTVYCVLKYYQCVYTYVYETLSFLTARRGVSMLRTHELVDLSRKGIPDKHCAHVWMVYSGADLQQSHPNECAELVSTLALSRASRLRRFRERPQEVSNAGHTNRMMRYQKFRCKINFVDALNGENWTHKIFATMNN